MTVYSPDGKRFLAGNKILDADTGLELASFGKEFNEIYEIDVSGTNREKRWIIIGHERYINTLVVWDAETGGEIQRIQSPLKRDEYIHLVSLSPDGGKILVNIKSNILLWDIETGNLVLSMTTDHSVDRLIFSPDGKKAVFCGYKGTPVTWDFESGNTAVYRGKKHEDSIVFIGHNIYKNQIITVSKDTIIKVWGVESGKYRNIITGHTSPIINAAMSPDGKYIITASGDHYHGQDCSFILWDTTTWKEIKKEKMDFYLGSLCFSPDAKYFLIGDQNEKENFWAWEISSGKVKRFYTLLRGYTERTTRNEADFATFNYDDKSFLCSAERKQIIFDIENKKNPLFIDADIYYPPAYSNDGKTIACVSSGIILYDSEPVQKMENIPSYRRILGSRSYLEHESIAAIAYSPDDDYLVTSSGDTTVKIRDAETGQKLMTLAGHGKTVGSVSFSPDGKYIASASEESSSVKIILWEVESGRKLQYIQLSSEKEDRYVFVTFSHDAKHLIYSHLNDIIIWDIEKEQAVITIPGHTEITSAALFLYGGEKIAVGHDDGSIAVLNIWNKQNDKTFSWREIPVNYLNVSHDGKRLLAAYKDGTILLWDIDTGQKLRIYSKFWIDFAGVSFEERDSYKNSWEKTMSLWRSIKGGIE